MQDLERRRVFQESFVAAFFLHDMARYKGQRNRVQQEEQNFEKVLDSANEVLEEESISCARRKHAQWYCKIQNEIDERIMHVTIQIFDLSV